MKSDWSRPDYASCYVGLARLGKATSGFFRLDRAASGFAQLGQCVTAEQARPETLKLGGQKTS